MKNFATYSALVIGSILVALFAGEIFVRIALPQQLILLRPDIWQPAEKVGWRHRPNLDTTVNTGEKSVRVYTDESGHRVGQAWNRDPDIRVLALGDSFIAAFQVEHEESVAGLVEAGIERALGRTARVTNAAVDQWDPNQYLMEAGRELTGRGYDMVVAFIYIGNDIVSRRFESLEPRRANTRHPLRLPGSLTRAELVHALLYPVNDLLEVRSHLFVLLKRRMNSLLMRAGLTASYFPFKYHGKDADPLLWDVTASICADIDALSRRHGAKAMFVLIPAPYQVDELTFNAYVKAFGIDAGKVDIAQPTRLMKERLELNGLEVVDLLPVMKEASRNGTALYGSVDMHFNKAGNRIAAEHLTPAVLAALAGPP